MRAVRAVRTIRLIVPLLWKFLAARLTGPARLKVSIGRRAKHREYSPECGNLH